MWNLSSIYPISKIFSLVFKKLNYFKDIKLLSFIARYRPWNVHVLANTPIHPIQTLYWTVHTKCFSHGGHTPFWCSSNLQGQKQTYFLSFFIHNSTVHCNQLIMNCCFEVKFITTDIYLVDLCVCRHRMNLQHWQ